MMILIQRLDRNILLYIENYLHIPIIDKAMIIITSIGNGGAIWILIAFILAFNKSYRMIGYVLILTLIISTIIGEGIIKHLVKRVRPCSNKNRCNLLITKPMSYSFPSGHTLSSFAAAEVLSRYFIQYRLIFILLALLIALSRIYLYVHYPTDVIAGIMFGVLCSKLVFAIIQEGYIERFVTLFQNNL